MWEEFLIKKIFINLLKATFNQLKYLKFYNL